jgi:hypothetical protein
VEASPADTPGISLGAMHPCMNTTPTDEWVLLVYHTAR